jgi:hypothetical protein
LARFCGSDTTYSREEYSSLFTHFAHQTPQPDTGGEWSPSY